MTRLPPLAGLVLLAIAPAAAQTCGPQWLPGDGFPGIEGTVHAITTWDPDGPGPATSLWTFGGEFTHAGSIPARRIAMYDPATGEWSTIPLGTGTTPLYALAPLPDGDLIVGGTFSVTAGAPALLSCIARWDGASWQPLGTGVGGTVRAITVLPNGHVVAGGLFSTAGGVTVNGLARWDGAAWSTLGSGSPTYPAAMIALPNGDLLAGGNSVQRWNGASWSAVGGAIGGVNALAVLENGDIVAAGNFDGRVARWNGTSWTMIGSALSYYADAVVALPGGDLIAGGGFYSVGGVTVNGVARWNGSSWSPLGAGTGSARCLKVLPNGDLLAGGLFSAPCGARAVARWDGVVWSPVSPGTDAPVEDLVNLPAGKVVAAGQFKCIGGSSASYIAQWNGAHWSTLGAGVNARVRTLAATSDGLVAGGDFTFAGGFAANRVARWNGSWWSTLGGGVLGGSHVRLVGASLSGNAAVVAGDFTVVGGHLVNGLAFWSGSSWLPLGGVSGAGITALAVLPGGEPVAAYDNAVYRWNGSAWTTLAQLGGLVYVLRELPGGDLIAGGAFTLSSGGPSIYMAKWDGSSWSPFPGGPPVPIPVVELAAMANGQLAVASSGNVFRWNGLKWSGVLPLIGQVQGLALVPGGEVVVCGPFTTAAGEASRYTARWTPTNIPWIALQPDAQTAQVGQGTVFECTPASRYTNLTAGWELETAPSSGVYVSLSEGPIPGAGPATAAITPPPAGTTPGPTTLAISGVSAALHDRRVRVTITNACGGVTSDPALLTVVGCYADCNADGALGVADFGCFQTRFVAADPYADCNASGGLSVQDFGCFQSAFATGCP